MPAVLCDSGEPKLPLRLGPPVPTEAEDDSLPPDWIEVTNIPEKKGLEDYYEIQPKSAWKNGRPIWSDGQNTIYMTSTNSWAIAVDRDGVHNNRGYLYDPAGDGDKKWPSVVSKWKVYDGKDWNDCKGRVVACSSPFLNVECDRRPDLNGCYCLISHEHAENSIWGHGQKRLYQDEVAGRWAICLQPSSMEDQGGSVCSSTEEPRRSRPDLVQQWVYHDGEDWEESDVCIWSCTRPPPVRLEVKCPEKPELDGMFKLCKDNINDKPSWNCGDNYVYFTSNKAWAVCIGKSSTENDRGWLYAQSRESKFPDKVTCWHAYDGSNWNESKAAKVAVPIGDRRKADLAPIFGERPADKPKGAAKAKAKPKAEPAAKPAAKPAPAKEPTKKLEEAPGTKSKKTHKKGLGRMGQDELEMGQARKDGKDQDTAAVTILPNTRWMEIKPTRSCLDEIRRLEAILPKAEDIADDVEMKVEELKFSAKEKVKEYELEDDDLAALCAYTHDLQNPDGTCAGNFYFEMNKALRRRGQEERKGMMESWGFVVHYLIKAMARLPDYSGECYRGYQGKETVLREYELGRPIQWGAFTSVTNLWDAAVEFSDAEDGVIFKIMVTNGRQICDFSFFPAEDEILLTPAHRFIVSSHPYEKEGFTIIDLVQQKNKVFVS